MTIPPAAVRRADVAASDRRGAPILRWCGGRKKRRKREWERDEARREEDRQIEADQTAAWLADDGRQPLHVKLPARSSGGPPPPGAKT
jgi:hypothetical protein